MNGKYQFPKTVGFTSIPVLEFLKGLPWNTITKNYVAAVRPNFVRESWGEIKTDACCWRVTVFLRGPKDFPIVDYIQQEVAVGLNGGFKNGFDLDRAYRLSGKRTTKASKRK